MTLKMCQGHLRSNIKITLIRIHLLCKFGYCILKPKEDGDDEMFTYFLYKMQCHDLENRSRSLVLELIKGLVGGDT